MQNPSKISSFSLKEMRKRRRTYGGELVAGVANEHAGLAHSSISNHDTLDELGGAHLSSPQENPSKAAREARQSYSQNRRDSLKEVPNPADEEDKTERKREQKRWKRRR